MWLLLFLVGCSVVIINAKPGPCFEFDGSSHIEFGHGDLSNGTHYVLTFRTRSPEGTLLFANGPHDYEALFLDNGILTYNLVNPEDSGVGGTGGAYIQSNHMVNNNTFLTVEVFRNRRVRRGLNLMPGEQAPLRTGMLLRDMATGKEEMHIGRVGLLERVQMLDTLYVGGRRQRILPEPVKYFTGQIKNVREKKEGITFEDSSYNNGVSRCLTPRQPS